jgi:hypothetical protein
MVKGISILDWAMLVLTLLSMLMAYLRGLQRLHPAARKWLSDIGEPLIKELAAEAAGMEDLTPDQRRAQVVELVHMAAYCATGAEIPTSIANYLVEHVYQSIKERLPQ